jgi:hypothetical protein
MCQRIFIIILQLTYKSVTIQALKNELTINQVNEVMIWLLIMKKVYISN